MICTSLTGTQVYVKSFITNTASGAAKARAKATAPGGPINPLHIGRIPSIQEDTFTVRVPNLLQTETFSTKIGSLEDTSGQAVMAEALMLDPSRPYVSSTASNESGWYVAVVVIAGDRSIRSFGGTFSESTTSARSFGGTFSERTTSAEGAKNTQDRIRAIPCKNVTKCCGG